MSSPKRRSNGHLAEVWRRLKKNKSAVAGLIILIVFLLIIIFADVIAPYDNAISNHAVDRLQWPSAAHFFGTDANGRDMFARVLHGARVSVFIGLSTGVVAIIIGAFLGSIAALYGGWVDTIIMRLLDIITSIPGILLALCIVSALGASMLNLMIAIMVTSIPGYTRVIRSVMLTITETDYIEAARAFGASKYHIIVRHLLPNAIGYIIIQLTIGIASGMLAAASVSFVGLGVPPPRPELGYMLSTAREYMRTYPYMMFFPGVAIVLAALSFNLLGDGLRDALDPRLRD